ncbi:hypothetical protein [Sphingomonas adhaesiva]|uniref:hypothetical protein n=1 Tax=Sphingomonas adhaesiva TaxID=28212 RepID=UPI002FF4FF72
MDAFEQLVAEFFWQEGYWVQTSVRVKLTKAQKVEIGRFSTPDWEVDVVAYRGATNELLASECKSFFDSTGVQAAEICNSEGATKGKYKLFCERTLRGVVLTRLREQMVEQGLCPPGPPARLGMVAGKIKKGDEEILASVFEHNGWLLLGGTWLRDGLLSLSKGSYRNHLAAVAAKILLRG